MFVSSALKRSTLRVIRNYLKLLKRKVPHAYSRADENARSLYGVRDDDC